MSILNVLNVSKTYKDVKALDDVSFSAELRIAFSISARLAVLIFLEMRPAR